MSVTFAMFCLFGWNHSVDLAHNQGKRESHKISEYQEDHHRPHKGCLSYYNKLLEIIFIWTLLLYLPFTLHFFLFSIPFHSNKIAFTLQEFEQVLIAEWPFLFHIFSVALVVFSLKPSLLSASFLQYFTDFPSTRSSLLCQFFLFF